MASNLSLTDPTQFLTQMFANSGQQTNPWYTIANQFVPRNLHDVIRWARYITIQSPTTTEVIRKLCTYPITEFLVDTDSEEIREKYEKVFQSFKLKQVLQDIGFDYHTLGNVFISIYFPIQRILTCPGCKIEYPAKKAEFTDFKNYMYLGTCPACSYKGQFLRRDIKSQNISDMNVIKWSPENIAVDHNPITGECEYYYKIPNDIKKKVQIGHKLFVNSVPWAFIEAVKNNQNFKFDNGNIFHLRNLSTGAIVEGCSVPPLISLYGLVFYQATLRKANEAIAMEHMNPLRVVFPAASGASIDPVVAMSMKNFVENIQDAIKRHKRDKNYFMISPAPVGYQPIGGDGKNLLVSQEIQQAEDTILLALGVSRELLSGLTNWTSSTVGLRMLHNTLLNYTMQLEGLINWIMHKVATYLSLPLCGVTLAPFRLADDDVMKQNLIELLKTGNISLSTVMESMGLDYSKELENIKDDMVEKAQNQIKTKFEVDQATFMAAKKTGDRLDQNTDYQAILVQAQQLAMQLGGPDAAASNEMLAELRIQNYPLYVMTMKLLEEQQAGMVQAPATDGTPPNEASTSEGGGSGGGAPSGGGDGEPTDEQDPHKHHKSKY
jgi:hypothetical protein